MITKEKHQDGQKCFSFGDARSWNGVRADYKLATSVNSFLKLMLRVDFDFVWLISNEEVFHQQDKEEDEEYLQYCKLCSGFKAPRAHHCRKCQRYKYAFYIDITITLINLR